jgi:hypothetical protein
MTSILAMLPASLATVALINLAVAAPLWYLRVDYE